MHVPWMSYEYAGLAARLYTKGHHLLSADVNMSLRPLEWLTVRPHRELKCSRVNMSYIFYFFILIFRLAPNFHEFDSFSPSLNIILSGEKRES
jgi:hypothetical protein